MVKKLTWLSTSKIIITIILFFGKPLLRSIFPQYYFTIKSNATIEFVIINNLLEDAIILIMIGIGIKIG